MGLFGGDTKTNVNNFAANDHGRVTSGNQNLAVESGAIGVGVNGRYQGANSIQLNGGILRTAPDFTQAKIEGSSINIGASGDQISTALKDVGQVVSEATAAAAGQSSGILATLAQALTTKNQTEAGQVSWFRDPVVWIGLTIAGLAIGGAYWLANRK